MVDFVEECFCFCFDCVVVIYCVVEVCVGCVCGEVFGVNCGVEC